MYHFRNRYLNFVGVGDTFKFLNTGEIFEIVKRQDKSDFYCETTSGNSTKATAEDVGLVRDWVHRKKLEQIRQQFEKDGLAYFAVIEDPKNPTLGASIYNGRGLGQASYNARQNHMEWERSKDIDTEHDWRNETTSGKGFKYSSIRKESFECVGDTYQNIVQRIIQNKINYLVEFFNFENEIELSTNVQDPNKHFKTFEKRFCDIQVSTYAPDLVDIIFIDDFRDYLVKIINKENFQTYGIKDSYLTMIPNEYFYYMSKS